MAVSAEAVGGAVSSALVEHRVEALAATGQVGTNILGGAVWRVDAGSLTEAGDGLADLAGGGRHAVFGDGSNAPVVLPWDGTDYVHIPAGSGNNVRIDVPGELPYTATRLDGSTVTGTSNPDILRFNDAGDWREVRTDDGQFIMNPANHNADFTRITNTGTAGGQWLTARTDTGYQTAIVTRPLILMGGGQTMIAPALSGTTDAVTVLVALRRYAPAGINEMFFDTKHPPAEPHGVFIADRDAANETQADVTTDTSQITLKAGLLVGSGQHVLAVRYDGATAELWVDGTVLASKAATGSITWTETLGLGCTGVSWRFTGAVIGAAVVERALTDDEMGFAGLELLGTPQTHGQRPTVELVAAGPPTAEPL